MRLIRFETPGGIRCGILEGEKVKELSEPFDALFPFVNAAMPLPERKRAEEKAAAKLLTGREYPLSGVRLLAPLIPGKVVGIGANYHSFLKEKGRPVPERPKLFLKPASSVCGPGDPILCRDPEHVYQFEAELAVIIGRTCRNVSREDALSYVFGYSCMNDVLDLTALSEDGWPARAKGQDSFAPFGPCVATGPDCADVLVSSRLNGVIAQNMSTSDMVFSVAYQIAYISGFMTLEPGDVLTTGAAAGAGRFFPGDTVECSAEGIGSISNRLTLTGKAEL